MAVDLAASLSQPLERPKTVRPTGVAGSFYPAEPGALSALMDQCLTRAGRPLPAPYKALIVPHAGYVYSGAVAASGYASLGRLKGTVKHVVVFGPAHRHAFNGLAVPPEDALATPFGQIAVDSAGRQTALSFPFVQTLGAAFDREHAIEVELPFLKRIFPEATVTPLLVGQVEPQQIATVMEALWGGPETLIIISSDLSHYLPQADAKALDSQTAALIEMLNTTSIIAKNACGHRPLNALLMLARKFDLRPMRLDVRTSGDITGETSRTVGYGSWGFEYASQARLPDTFRATLLDIAKKSLVYAAANGKSPQIDLDSFPFPFRTHARTFVTLKKNGQLRGCIGMYEPLNPLIKDVVENTFKAACQDPRFKPVLPEEVAQLSLSISILSTPRVLDCSSEADLVSKLQPDVDGLVIAGAGKKAIFLPHVWEDIHDPRTFVQALKRKAGLQPQEWPQDMKAWRYSAECF